MSLKTERMIPTVLEESENSATAGGVAAECTLAESEVELQLDYAAAIADWFLDLGDAHFRRSEYEQGLRYNQLAGSILCRQSRDLASARIEANLLKAAHVLPEQAEATIEVPGDASKKETCLHVLSEAMTNGGHTAMAMRWMSNDLSGRTHSVALLCQKLPLPEDLARSVRERGGEIHISNPNDPILSKAAWLRQLSRRTADHVVLHIDVSDVICGVAFGVTGGPPVLLVNHAAHIFWTGVSTTDLVVNCRGSALEEHWTRFHRGARRCATVTIPLVAPEKVDEAQSRKQARERLEIPADVVLILTVGASYKFLPAKQLDFVRTCEDILEAIPGAIIVAVGPENDSRWSAASERTRFRLRAIGNQPRSQVASYQQAADIHIEGFPFGSTTALLEAGLRGLPVVLAPAQCPPPFGSDGVALDDTLERPDSLEAYKARIVELSKSPALRAACGEKIRASVTRHHTGAGWRRYLKDAIDALPAEHSIDSEITPVQTPYTFYDYWWTVRGTWSFGYEATLEMAVADALYLSLRPRLTPRVIQACKNVRLLRRSRAIPWPILLLLCNFLLPLLPPTLARRIFSGLASLFRRSLLARARGKVGARYVN